MKRQASKEALVLIEVPWDGTQHYAAGMSSASTTAAIMREFSNLEPHAAIAMERPIPVPFVNSRNQDAVNLASERLNATVYKHAQSVLQSKKFAAVVGGQRSSSYGLIKALSEKQSSFGILHIGAQLSLREAHQGYLYSHASIFRDVLEDFLQVKKLVLVGTRDHSRSEADFLAKNKARAVAYYDETLAQRQFSGEPFAKTVSEIVNQLPDQLYVSFDMGGLDKSVCHNNLPGGLSYREAIFLLNRLGENGRKLIGFDVCEALGHDGSKDSAIAGARVLHKLCELLMSTQKLTGSL